MRDPNRLTIIVGAGGSNEFGLPIGAELKDRISKLLDIRFENGHRQKSGDYLIMDALRFRCRQTSEDSNTYLHAARQIRDALPLAPSIDQYINTQRGNNLIEVCGKFAIVRAILDAEANSALHIDRRSGRECFNIKNTSNTWLGCLFRVIVDGCQSEELDDRFRSITLIIFNYDRCVEHYLYHALQTYYNVAPLRAVELVSRIHVLHPYGSVGKLPWQDRAQHIDFGVEPSVEQITQLANRIKTFTEGTDPSDSDMLEIRSSLAVATRVLFLGFAFHPLNLELLKPDDRVGTSLDRRVFATALGLSDYDCDDIRDELANMLGCDANAIHIKNDRKACEIFSTYSRSLSFESVSV